MKKFWFILNFVCFSMMLSTTAFAYIDPSVMTYTVQIVAGIVVAAGAVVGMWWRRIKRRLYGTLGIDESAKKEVEEDIVSYFDDEM